VTSWATWSFSVRTLLHGARQPDIFVIFLIQSVELDGSNFSVIILKYVTYVTDCCESYVLCLMIAVFFFQFLLSLESTELILINIIIAVTTILAIIACSH
jgi:hypothetical protein